MTENGVGIFSTSVAYANEYSADGVLRIIAEG